RRGAGDQCPDRPPGTPHFRRPGTLRRTVSRRGVLGSGGRHLGGHAMGDDNRFFRWLARINSILFFLVVAGIGLLIGTNMGLDFFMPHHVAHGAQGAVETASGDVYDFGGNLNVTVDDSSAMTRLEGTQEGIMVLQRQAPPRGKFSSRARYGETANV